MDCIVVRGYYYDTDTGFYYLQSRYYDPTICRFINADTFATTDIDGLISTNMFSYCENNPITRSDPSGEFYHILAGTAIGGIINGIATFVSGGDLTAVLISVGTGAVSGALSSAGVPVGAMAAINAGFGAAERVIDDLRANADKTESEKRSGWQIFGRACVDASVSALFSFAGGPSNGKQLSELYKTSKASKKALKNILHPKTRATHMRNINKYKVGLKRFCYSNFISSTVSSTFSTGSKALFKAGW